MTEHDEGSTTKNQPPAPLPSRDVTVCPTCGAAASGPGLYFAGDNTICNEPTHAGSTATVSRCGNCGHAMHDRQCEVWVPTAGGGVVCGCTVCFLDTASAALCETSTTEAPRPLDDFRRTTTTRSE